MEKARNFCRVFIWAMIGSLVGRTLHVYFFYKKNPGILEMMSEPWYAELILPLCITIVLIVILILIRVVLKKLDKESHLGE